MYGFVGKRILDVIIASCALVALSIPLICVALAIKLTSKGDILFKQQRIGLNGELFKIYKFRTLNSHMCYDGYQANTEVDAKTKIGNFLRTYSIDELPQLFNILGGSMSVVGPRPHPVYLDTKFGVNVLTSQRYTVKPGLTGLAQVSGSRGETKTAEDLMCRVLYDLDYISDVSLKNDIKIMFRTFNALTSNKGS